VIEIFERNISELDEQITALSTVKSILSRLVQELHEKANMRLQLDYLGDSSVFAIVHSVSFPKNTIQSGGSQSELPGYATEEEKSMDDLNKANESLTKLNDSDVRIVYLPPMTVAVSYASGDFEWGPGLEATSKIEQFVKDSELLKIKPDSRGMGFDCSKETRKAYEAWVSIPEDMEVPAPLAKKIFSGGMFVAHVLRDWNFERDWGLLKEWAVSSEKYEIDEERPFFEEMLNYNNLLQSGAQMDDTQIDLLLPIRAITK